jgi:dTDP-4-amino-4,6-dideoxygalactose transaminase
MDWLPVLRPRLPTADRLLPYLRSIDESRIYSNHGPLVSQLQQRLAHLFRVPLGGIICTSSGTSAIVGAVLAAAGRARASRPLALMPAFTFVGTACALEQCGYRLYFGDIGPDTWMLEPERFLDHPMLDRIGVVVPVAPFGRPVPQEPWRHFRRATGIPVVVDGAAAFDTALRHQAETIGDILVAVSFHATKSFGTGEGGAVISTDTALVALVTQSLNFGFYGSRNALSASTNGKMSEYNAAVGLAELDAWEAKQSSLLQVFDYYQRISVAAGLSDSIHTWPTISGAYALFQSRSITDAEAIQASLERHKIDNRFWYGRGLHHHSYYSTVERDCLHMTESLAPRLIGLPIAPDLTEANIGRVINAVKKGIKS